MIVALLLAMAPVPSIPYWLYRVDPPTVVQYRLDHHAQREQDQADYEEAVQEQIDKMKDSPRKADLQDKLTTYESDENYPEYLKQDREDIEDAFADCDDCDDPDDAGYPRRR